LDINVRGERDESYKKLGAGGIGASMRRLGDPWS
jgi:hypothetical protein